MNDDEIEPQLPPELRRELIETHLSALHRSRIANKIGGLLLKIWAERAKPQPNAACVTALEAEIARIERDEYPNEELTRRLLLGEP
jgi:hypothetical protein